MPKQKEIIEAEGYALINKHSAIICNPKLLVFRTEIEAFREKRDKERVIRVKIVPLS